MPDISPMGPGSLGPADRTALSGLRPELRTPGHGSESVDRRADRVELSEHARTLDRLHRLPAVRSERLAAIREAIANGTYEDEHRLTTAMERLLEDLSND